MYMRAVGWNVGRKDKIDLDGPSLKEKQGLYACPSPEGRGQALPLRPGSARGADQGACCLQLHSLKSSIPYSAHQALLVEKLGTA